MAKAKHQEQVQEAQAAEPAASSTDEITIQGFTFSYSTPYKVGHELNEAEANQLNTVRGENVRNNFATQVKEVKTKAEAEGREVSEDELADLRAKFAAYEAGYVFSGKRAPRAPLDPVKAAARRIARTTIETAIRAKGLKPSDLQEGRMDSLIDQFLDGHPEVTEEARRQVEAVKSAAQDALAGVDLDSLTEKAAA